MCVCGKIIQYLMSLKTEFNIKKSETINIDKLMQLLKYCTESSS